MKIPKEISDIIKTNLSNCTTNQLSLLEKYVELLIEWNSKINLISRNDLINIWTRHILHSISPLFLFKFKINSHAIDIGTGGGLPGLPIAILEPNIKITLLDSIRKKCSVVEDIYTKLGIKNISVVNKRAEDLAQDKAYSKSFDYVLARAVAPTVKLIEWSIPLLKNGVDFKSPLSEDKIVTPKSIVLWKGGDLTNEIEDAKNKFQPKNISIFPLQTEYFSNDINSDKKIILINL
ncbi:MAG: 16S rRNA (guanine(527)-N(7))-methyltransferase RsmG [Ignavibacteriales bacterium]|nr:16S rRNA (guanine(527)-N(7))-methyltransferase RsmG [Ignavibacteriales bacterium]